MQTNEADFIAAIRAAPDDDTPRLVFADWLEEMGDPRGEFIRIQCELARLPFWDPSRWDLVQRETKLLNTHRKDWTRKLLDFGVSPSGIVFRRGVMDCEIPAKLYAKQAEAIHAACPMFFGLKIGYISRSDKRLLNNVLNQPAIAELTSLSLENVRCLKVADLKGLAKSGNVEGLRCLNLSGCQLGGTALKEIVAGFPSVQLLNFHNNLLGKSGVQCLLGSPDLAQFKMLDLSETLAVAGGHGGAFLRGEPNCPNLESLGLGNNFIGRGGTADYRADHDMTSLDMLAATQLPSLRYLDLSANDLQDVHAQRLVEGSLIATLVSLCLSGNQFSAQGVSALANGERLGNLRALDLRGDLAREAGGLLASRSIDALANGSGLRELRWLAINNGLDAAPVISKLLDSPKLPKLSGLHVGGATKIEVQQWLKSAGFSRIQSFDIYSGAEATTEILTSPQAANLRYLGLDAFDGMAEAIETSPYLRDLAHLHVRHFARHFADSDPLAAWGRENDVRITHE